MKSKAGLTGFPPMNDVWRYPGRMIGPSQTDVCPGAMLGSGFVPVGRARITHGELGRLDAGMSALNDPLDASTPVFSASAPPCGVTQSSVTVVPLPVAVPATCSVSEGGASLLFSGCDRFAGSVTCVALKLADAGLATTSAPTDATTVTSHRAPVMRTTLCARALVRK